MSIHTLKKTTFDDFLNEVLHRPSIRLIKLDDYGFVSPVSKVPGTIVMMPQVKIIATAFDRKDDVLIRWEETMKASQSVTIVTDNLQGTHGESRVRRKAADLKQRLEIEGFAVTKGEWTEEELNRLLQHA
jgi:hypothetical protein